MLIGIKLDDGNASDISSDPYSDCSDCGSDVESCWELETESSANPDGPKIYRKGWRTKSSSNGITKLDLTDSSESKSDFVNEAPCITHQVRMIRVVKHGKESSPDEKVPPIENEANTRNSSGISNEEQKKSSKGATVNGIKESQEKRRRRQSIC